MRIIRDGDSYEDGEDVELDIPFMVSDPPPVETRGEPMGWTKGPPYPRGYREDGEYPGRFNRGDPGPFDGLWDDPNAS